MSTAIRLLTLILIVSLMVGGPLAPALAQQPMQSAPPAPPPDLFQETLKASRAGERGPGGPDRTPVVYSLGAGVVNLFLIPGHTITCVLGAGVGVVLLALTLGSGYKAAAGAADEGCGGKWVVTGEDLRPEGPQVREFDWERR
jgi:hypothetical protein